VARILAHEAGVTDIVVLQAALLHDTVEDTDTTLSEIEERFGVSAWGRAGPAPCTEGQTCRGHPGPGVAPARGSVGSICPVVCRCPGVGWSAERVQEYFRWAALVVSGLRGTSAPLEGALQRLFEERGVTT
ncbi:Guanosine-3',5'-bis(diphosphate) 3'-pyrophosphohydrolase MESH1, partial [Manacus vitellinus]